MPQYFADRLLDSFTDEVITRASKASHGGWYACLDWGPHDGPGQPDYSTCASTEAEARKLCANRIRKDIAAAKRSCFQPFDLRYKLQAHWASKELFLHGIK